MRSTPFFLLFATVPFVLFAEDAPMPSVKKEKMPQLPHVWVSGDLLCLKAQENGLAFANRSQPITATTDFVDGRIIQPHFKWNCGVRINVGYQPLQQFFFATWTYIQNTAHGRKSTDAASGFSPVLSLNPANTPDTFVTSGDINWNLNTHLIDLGTSFPWTPVNFFILKGHIGLRIASLNQKFEADYGGGAFNLGIDSLKMFNNFLGLGPSVGVNSSFILPWGFSIYGDFTASGYGGHFHVQQKEKYLTEYLFNDTRNFNRLRCSIDAKAALSWQKDLFYKILLLGVQIGWEWHEFFDQKEWRQSRFHFFNSNKNVIMRGAFISLTVGF
jgi:hypothetical protein